MECLTRLHIDMRLLAVPTNISLGCKWLVVTNTLVECTTWLYIEDRLKVVPENIRLRVTKA